MRVAVMVVFAMLAMAASAKRQLCRFTMRCECFAEEGHKFCPMHECQSYGCKEAVAFVVVKTDNGGYRGHASGYHHNSRDSKQTYLGGFCKKHMCNRKAPEVPRRGKNEKLGGRWRRWGSSSGFDDEYCKLERLNDGRFCIEHTCKVPNCHAPVWEFWDHDGQGDLVLKTMSTCRGHSQLDPESINGRSDRDRKTPGDIKRERDEKRQQNREMEAAEKMAREQREREAKAQKAKEQEAKAQKAKEQGAKEQETKAKSKKAKKKTTGK